jgi:hypothetical protein
VSEDEIELIVSYRYSYDGWSRWLINDTNKI